MTLRLPVAALLLALLAACQTATAPASTTPDEAQAYAGVGAEEQLRFTGTEPFWGGEVRAGRMVYTSPDNQKGETVDISRVVGSGGIAFSGHLAAGAFVMTARLAGCSDGMSDRTYPFTVTIEFTGYTLRGCGWTARRPFAAEAGG